MSIRTTVHLLAGLAALSVSLPARAAPAEDPKRYLGTAKWYLDSTVHVHGTGQSEQSGPLAHTTVWRINRSCSARSVLDEALAGRWVRAIPERETRGRFMLWKADLDKRPRPYVLTGPVSVDDETATTFKEDATGSIFSRTTWQGRAIVQVDNTMELYVDTVKKVYCLRVPYAYRSAGFTHTRFVRLVEFTENFWPGGRRVHEPDTQERLIEPTDLQVVVPDHNTLLTRTTGTNAAGDWWTLQTPDMPLPPNGSTLSGSLSLPGHCGTDRPVHIDVTWTCLPTPGPDLELVVSLKGDGGETYENWAPVGGGATAGGRFFESTPGNGIVVTAELRGIGTGEAVAKADQIRFELTGVSREPGVCMNAPKFPTATPYPDLGFDPQRHRGRVQVHGVDWQRADEDAGADLISRSSATVTSFDYGAWGDLKVTAYLKDGRTIVGHLEGFKDMTVIPLPKRQGGSLIADRWLRDHGVVGKADKADDEEVPSGDNSNGDGLALYEEYRGFADGGVWTSGNPTRKDFFIHDRVGGRSKDGIDLFAGITQLNVHHSLYAWEIKDRVINFNHAAGPHVVDQHGVVLMREMFKSCGEAVGGPGTPKDIQHVYIGTGYSPTAPFQEFTVSGRVLRRDLWAATIAHELSHCCNIWHHGEEDEPKVPWITIVNAEGGNVQLFEFPSDGQTASDLTQIVCVREDGTLIPNEHRKDPWTVYVGVPQGQHSGVEDCVMRYDCAYCYRSRKAGESHVRYVVRGDVRGDEVVGSILCEDTKGTGRNGPLHKPHSRYGDAHHGRGACRYQICVNDALDPPSRDY